MSPTIQTERLVLRPWREDDAADALVIYGATNAVSMRGVLYQWKQESDGSSGTTHWAIEQHDTRWLLGGIAVRPVPGRRDLSITWQLAPAAWGQGFAAEAGAAVVRWAMERDDIDSSPDVTAARSRRR